MAAFRFKQRRTRRWWYLGASLVAVALFSVFMVAGAGAVSGSPSNFESADAIFPGSNPPSSDANMTVDTSGNTDWNCFANGNSTGFANPAGGITVGSGNPAATCNTNLASHYGDAFAKTDPAATQTDDSWVNGTKFDNSCEPLGQNKNPGKDDFSNVASYTEVASNKHQFLYGATIRVAPNGSASENVELNQNPGTTSCPITRTAGDHLLAFDYNAGGKALNLHVLTWIDSTHQTLGGNNGTCTVKTDPLPCWGANVLTPADSSFDGGTNQSAITAKANGISNTALVAGLFAEFGVDLTTALGQSTSACSSTAQIDWESRSSGSSFSSNPEDIAIENKSFSNCGGIIIRKVTSPSPDVPNTDFSFGDNIANGSDTFTLKNGGSKDFGSGVQAGGYNVTETPHAGYTLSNIDCSASSVSNGSSVTFGTSDSSFVAGDTKVNITLKAGDSIDCTYTNTLQTATLTTSQSTTADVTPGTSVHDTATVTGSVSSLTPSGTVTFYLCGPFTSQPADTATGCSSSDSTRTQLATVPGNTLGGSGATATATSANVNTGSGLSPGWYCFEATWPGDSNYIGSKDVTAAANECFHVAKVNAPTTTTPNNGTGVTGAESTITLGGTIYDTAVVQGTAGLGFPTGKVQFYVCSGSAACTSSGTDQGNIDLAQVGATNNSSATSNGFTPTATGTYCFLGVYSGNNVYNTSSDSGSNECFTVTDTTTSSSAQTWYPNDSASVSGDHGATLSGTLTITLYTGNNCGATSGSAVSPAVTFSSGDQTGKSTITVDSNKQTTYGVDAAHAGNFSWKVVFTSDDSNVSGSNHCESSSLSISN